MGRESQRLTPLPQDSVERDKVLSQENESMLGHLQQIKENYSPTLDQGERGRPTMAHETVPHFLAISHLDTVTESESLAIPQQINKRT